MTDPQTFSVWAQTFSAPIALLIGMMAFRGYVKVKSFPTLLLSISFFLLASLSILPILDVLNLFHLHAVDRWGFEDMATTIMVLDALSIVQITAFILLTIIYLSELRNSLIQLNRIQLDTLAVALAALMVFSLFIYVRFSGNSYGHAVFPYLSAVLSAVLVTVIVVVMFSFYRTKGHRNTILGMVGFLLILSSTACGILSYYPGISSSIDNLTGGWTPAIAAVTSLVGYFVFLGAIIQARMHHG